MNIGGLEIVLTYLRKMHIESQSICLKLFNILAMKFTKLANNLVYLIERICIVASLKVFIKVMRHKMSLFIW